MVSLIMNLCLRTNASIRLSMEDMRKSWMDGDFLLFAMPGTIVGELMTVQVISFCPILQVTHWQWRDRARAVTFCIHQSCNEWLLLPVA
ncbi:unnamed protein product [Calypogeia fissa]